MRGTFHITVNSHVPAWLKQRFTRGSNTEAYALCRGSVGMGRRPANLSARRRALWRSAKSERTQDARSTNARHNPLRLKRNGAQHDWANPKPPSSPPSTFGPRKPSHAWWPGVPTKPQQRANTPHQRIRWDRPRARIPQAGCKAARVWAHMVPPRG